MIVANLLSGLTEVYLGNENIAQVYYASHLVWPTPIPPTTKVLYVTDEDVEATYDCGHQAYNYNYPSQLYDAKIYGETETIDMCNTLSGQSITSITFGECVEEIQDYALSKAHYGSKVAIRSLKTIDMSNSQIKTIGSYSFAGGGTPYSALTSVVFSDVLETIGNYAFTYCPHLRRITLPNTVKTIGNNAFSPSEALEISLGNGVETIGASAFANASSIQRIVIPNSVTSLGESAFENATHATSLTIGSGLKTIQANTFKGCNMLKVINIPNTVKTIGNQAFSGCSSASAITIGSGCTTIEANAFRLCSSATTVSMGNKVTSIGADAFNGCGAMTSITLSNTLDTIGANAFNNCSSLTSIVYPDSVYQIGAQQFYNNFSVTAITYGSGVGIIGGNEGIYACQTMTVKATVPPVLNGNFAFGEGVDYKIYVPSESVEDYKNATNWSRYADHIYPITE